MKVFKFGGASVKDAEAVRNVARILREYEGQPLVVVISAMGKMTNALEKVANAWFKKENTRPHLEAVISFHDKIMNDLGFEESHPVRGEVANSFVEIEWVIEEDISKGYGFGYDQIVSHGELISTRIISTYLAREQMKNTWMDARDFIQTDNTWREGKIDWDLTCRLVNMKVKPIASKSLVITQGFIGATSENFTTTLGREGSDYTAAILSYCLDAAEMVVWKDVPGVLSADPKFYEDVVRLEQISYLDAIELTYYGATVIHPKTIKPLENKNIPLRVCSFKSPSEKGTNIHDYATTKPLVPSFIFKSDQILFSIASKDFSFIAEENLSRIFAIFAKHKIKMNLMQNSAVSFSVCVDNDPFKIPALQDELHEEFRVLFNDKLRLITIRHYYQSTIDELTRDKTIILEQRSRHTAQIVLKES